MFQERIRSARKYRGYTQSYCAQYLGIALRSYQRYEEGKSVPAFTVVIKFAELFDVPTDWLFGRDDYLQSLGVDVEIPLEAPPEHPKQ